MEWYRNPIFGTIISYCPTSELMLTGENQISAWHSSPPNILEHSNNLTHFIKRSRWQRDCAVLPIFQFHVGQNPKLELEVTKAESDWQFCVSIKGRGGAPLISSGWQNGPRKMAFDLKKELQNLGYNLQYAELHFAIGVWTPSPNDEAKLRFRLSMPSQNTLIASLPVIRTIQQSKAKGIPLETLAVSSKGQLFNANKVKLFATVMGKVFPFVEKGGIWETNLTNLNQIIEQYQMLKL
jgi:hypothetical protein